MANYWLYPIKGQDFWHLLDKYHYIDEEGNRSPLYAWQDGKSPRLFSFKNNKSFSIGDVIKEDGIEWEFTSESAPKSAMFGGERIDPFSQNQFVEKTGNSKGTFGDVLDRSRELSEKRAQKNGGVDPVKQKYFKDYRKKRNGVRHHLDKKSRDFEKNGIKVEF